MAQNPFEMPKAMRDLAEKNVEQAQTAFRQFSDAMTQAMGMWSKAIPANEATAGFAAVQDRAVSFAKQNAEAGLALASDLAKVKTPQDILALQSRYTQSQMQAYVQQTQEIGRLMAEAMQGITSKH